MSDPKPKKSKRDLENKRKKELKKQKKLDQKLIDRYGY